LEQNLHDFVLRSLSELIPRDFVLWQESAMLDDLMTPFPTPAFTPTPAFIATTTGVIITSTRLWCGATAVVLRLGT
jgi:hypothetical protein